MNVRPFALFASVALALAVGCSSSSSGGGGGGGASCTISSGGVSECINYTNLPAGSDPDSACTAQGGMVASSCPTANVTGCCTQTASGIDEEICYYNESAQASTYQSACTSGGGTWATTP